MVLRSGKKKKTIFLTTFTFYATTGHNYTIQRLRIRAATRIFGALSSGRRLHRSATDATQRTIVRISIFPSGKICVTLATRAFTLERFVNNSKCKTSTSFSLDKRPCSNSSQGLYVFWSGETKQTVIMVSSTRSFAHAVSNSPIWPYHRVEVRAHRVFASENVY